MAYDPTTLPPDLPEPQDDGAADHLPGSDPPGRHARGDLLAVRPSPGPAAHRPLRLSAHRLPNQPHLVDDWDLIPGARLHARGLLVPRPPHGLRRGGGGRVRDVVVEEDEREAVERLHLPFPLLSDADLSLTRGLALPTFEAAGQTLIKRLTLVVADGVVEHAFYPVFPPDTHADDVLAWLKR